MHGSGRAKQPLWLVGTVRCAVPGGKPAGTDALKAGLTTFVAPAVRARTA